MNMLETIFQSKNFNFSDGVRKRLLDIFILFKIFSHLFILRENRLILIYSKCINHQCYQLYVLKIQKCIKNLIRINLMTHEGNKNLLN